MEYTSLGNSELSVSQLGFGCMSLSPDAPNNETLLQAAVDAGINYFDTADLYDKGLNEEIVGKALSPIRNRVILATKVGNQWREDGSGWDWNPTKKYILKTVEESLRRLNTDYIDLYQLHGGTINDPIDETIEAFELLKSQGKIREYGISSIRPNVIKAWAERSNMVSVMMQYSLLDRRPEEEMLNFLGKHNISVLARGSLAKGLLINKPAKAYLGYSEEEVAALKKVVSTSGNPLSLSLHYVLQHPAVASAVVGIRTPQQLTELLHAITDNPQKDIFRKISHTLAPLTYQQHR